jgi:hypothetical protein
MEEILRDLARLRNYAAGLQQVMADFQQAAPEHSQGTDRSGAVQAVLGADGLPEAIRVDAHWGNRLRAGSFGAAVVEASEAAMRERGAAWSRALKRSDWQRRVDLLETGPASAAAADPGTVPPAFRRPGGSARPLAELAEDVIGALDAVAAPVPEVPDGPRGAAANRDGTLTLTLSPSGQVSCRADPRWVAGRTGAQLTEALSAVLTAARQDLAASSRAAAASRDGAAERQGQLMAEILAALEDPRRIS